MIPDYDLKTGYVGSIARGMVKNYGTIRKALIECQRNIDSPLTMEGGRIFWGAVKIELEKMSTLAETMK